MGIGGFLFFGLDFLSIIQAGIHSFSGNVERDHVVSEERANGVDHRDWLAPDGSGGFVAKMDLIPYGVRYK